MHWIAQILEKRSYATDHWTHYQEPTTIELDAATDMISELGLKHKYDTILVDEGQDFRESWWQLVDEAMLSAEHGILRIFHDDNQSLLPQRAKYPLAEAPFPLSKNCRNAGKVFQLVRRFHA